MLPQLPITLRVAVDPAEAEHIITRFLKDYLASSGRKGFVIGLSGGIDSAVSAALATRAVGASKVHPLVLPEDATERGHLEDAHAVAEQLRLKTQTLSIQPLVDAFMKTYPKPDRAQLANAKARYRMIILHAEAARREGLVLGTGNKSEILTGYFCYDAHTRALTPEGPRRYDELRPGDIVFSMNLSTREVEEVPLQDVHIFDYAGDLIEVTTDRLSFQVTPNHRVLLARNHGRGKLGFQAAAERMVGGVTAIPLPRPWRGLRAAPTEIDTNNYLRSPLAYNANPAPKMPISDFLYLTGLFIGDGNLATSRVKASWKGLTRTQYMQTRRLENGQFPAADVAVQTKIYPAPRVHIAAATGKRSRGPLLELLERNQLPATERPTQVLIANRALHDSFIECGHGAKNKRIPAWILKLPADALSHLYRGLMDSDGNASGRTYNTSSTTLAHQMVELCAKLGKHAWIRWRGPRTSNHKGVPIRSKGYFEVRIGQKSANLAFGPQNMRRVPYKGKVWCVEAPPHGNLLVERAGHFVFSGNSKFGDAGVDLQPIGDLYKTQVRALARHLGLPDRVITKPPTAGLWAGQTDEAELGIDYERLDRILLGLEIKLPVETIASVVGVRPDEVRRIDSMRMRSQHKRRMPLMPKIGLRSVGVDWRTPTWEG